MKKIIFPLITIALILISCSSKQTLTINISEDGKSFYWKFKGEKIDPLEKKLSWKMETRQWGQNGKPIEMDGMTSFVLGSNEYQAVAVFNYDDKGYKHISLTITGGDLENPVSAEAERP